MLLTGNRAFLDADQVLIFPSLFHRQPHRFPVHTSARCNLIAGQVAHAMGSILVCNDAHDRHLGNRQPSGEVRRHDARVREPVPAVVRRLFVR